MFYYPAYRVCYDDINLILQDFNQYAYGTLCQNFSTPWKILFSTRVVKSIMEFGLVSISLCFLISIRPVNALPDESVQSPNSAGRVQFLPAT